MVRVLGAANMIKTSIAMVLATTCMLVVPALAQGNIFSHFDRDKNGRVTVGEISDARDAEIIAFMDTNKDGGVTPDEWQTKGRGASYVEKGGVDDRGLTRRWIEFNVVFFEFENEVISTNWTQGQAPLAADASSQDVEKLRQTLDAQNMTPPDSFARAVEQIPASN
jgi:EF hand